MAKTKTKTKTKQTDTEPHYVQVDVQPPRCPSCQSTEREPYFAIKRIATSGISPAGEPYNRITWKRTRCKRCGQRRVDRIFEQVSS